MQKVTKQAENITALNKLETCMICSHLLIRFDLMVKDISEKFEKLDLDDLMV